VLVGRQVPGGVLSWNRIKTRKGNHNGDVLGYGEDLFFLMEMYYRYAPKMTI